MWVIVTCRLQIGNDERRSSVLMVIRFIWLITIYIQTRFSHTSVIISMFCMVQKCSELH